MGILSRSKPALGSVSEKKKKNQTKVSRLEEYLQQRDYLGALTLLEVRGVGRSEDSANSGERKLILKDFFHGHSMRSSLTANSGNIAHMSFI
uniref:Uncharacterized protein n=1 Tax=Labrus bergylta TaxID=56723 RepID=A0A3Q3G5R9_9LABR